MVMLTVIEYVLSVAKVSYTGSVLFCKTTGWPKYSHGYNDPSFPEHNVNRCKRYHGKDIPLKNSRRFFNKTFVEKMFLTESIRHGGAYS